ncbi:membrane protein insertion efficiency factor YidD [Chryseobacterium sp.]|uniref:membrane protein insertion efficiency factor YidD n=1 Tax=Chryseobacterium sp. TaxID=1871047 RepID=UPI00345BED42
MKILTYPLNLIAIFLIKIYKRTKKRKHDRCLHFPSCSEYGFMAFKKYNFFKASIKTISRIRDCNPFSNRQYIDYP